MSARGKARKRALDVLYEADVRGVEPAETLASHLSRAEPAVSEYAVALVEGVAQHRERIDSLIATGAVGWTLERMPAVDRNILRLGVFELLWCDDIPDAVALSEAARLARDLSTDESPGFVNGLLARLAENKPSVVD